MSNKTLIIGFGMAGASIAHRLDNASKDFTIISDDSQLATRTAGGVINPIALKRYKKAWNADLYYNTALSFYRNLERKLSVEFLKSKPIFKALKSAEDINNFIAASDRLFLDQFLSSKLLNIENLFKETKHIGEVKSTYTIDLVKFLNHSIQCFKSQFVFDTFRYDELKCLDNGSFIYRDVEYENIIFCEGFGVVKNPFFNDLPLYGNKGEYIIISSKSLNLNDVILKSKYFLIPIGQNRYKFGANYDREQLNNVPTSETKKHLIEELNKMIDCTYDVINQVAAVRPTIKDRKPIIGHHPEHKQMYLFNGFGSRGVLSAPSLSEQLYNFIFKNTSIDSDVNLNRFYSSL